MKESNERTSGCILRHFFDPVAEIELFESTFFVKPKAPKCIRLERSTLGETGPKKQQK